MISQWNAQTIGAADSEKVPSDISYDKNGKPAKWGFGLGSNDSSIRWAKLLLTRCSLNNMNDSQEPLLKATSKQLLELKITAVDAIADYLRFLWEHILERLRVRLTQVALDNMIFKIVLTIPAIWDHIAQESMRLAASKAGLLQDRPCGKTELTLVAEPTAAALATYIDAAIKLNPLMQVLLCKCYNVDFVANTTLHFRSETHF
jgi:molecular chaperone DnaK (HSP70)